MNSSLVPSKKQKNYRPLSCQNLTSVKKSNPIKNFHIIVRFTPNIVICETYSEEKHKNKGNLTKGDIGRLKSASLNQIYYKYEYILPMKKCLFLILKKYHGLNNTKLYTHSISTLLHNGLSPLFIFPICKNVKGSQIHSFFEIITFFP